jgi:hypothetical protein
MPCSPIGLTDKQLQLLLAAAGLLAHSARASFLCLFADALGTEPVTDESVARAIVHVLRGGDMLVKEIAHRLRVRALNAEVNGDVTLAQDLRLALDDREAQLRNVMKIDGHEQTRRACSSENENAA